MIVRYWRVALVVALIAGFAGWLALHDRAVVQRHEEKIEQQAAPARDQAATERVDDAVTNTRNEQDLHNAIDAAATGNTPGSAVSPALNPLAHALACERLRKLGRVPAACRPEGGDRGQAGAR
jgi:hypothetical protein